MKERKRTRLKGYDYSTAGYYFVTVCVEKKQRLLCNIKNGEVEYTEKGDIVNQIWNDIPNHYNNILLEESIIMPNHIHSIIRIACRDSAPALSKRQCRDIAPALSAGAKTGGAQCTPPTYGLLSKVIQAFKSISKKKTGIKWQRSFHDRVIRNEKTYLNAREYIQTNPVKWDVDVENTGGDAKEYYKKIIE